jgi:hypothetical protein
MPDQPDDLPPELPTSTVTFLFSDIEGSTKLLQRLVERYGAGARRPPAPPAPGAGRPPRPRDRHGRRWLYREFNRSGSVACQAQVTALLPEFVIVCDPSPDCDLQYPLCSPRCHVSGLIDTDYGAAVGVAVACRRGVAANGNRESLQTADGGPSWIPVSSPSR